MSDRIDKELHGLTRIHRDNQEDMAYKLNTPVDDHNELYYRRIMFHAQGGLDRLPKCLQRNEQGKIELKEK